MIRVHASCVALRDTGVLLRGPSGAGKSDLALRLIDGGAALVADDYVELTRHGERVVATAPASITGLIEVRALGVFSLPVRFSAEIGLIVDLVAADAVERLPEPTVETILGCTIERVGLCPWEPSAAAKVRLAVQAVTRDIRRLS
jgi:serine kinase of HPr protein (carbohydrate metabolism regulator)